MPKSINKPNSNAHPTTKILTQKKNNSNSLLLEKTKLTLHHLIIKTLLISASPID